MTVIAPGLWSGDEDPLKFRFYNAALLSGPFEDAAGSVVDLLRRGLESARLIRTLGHSRRGAGTQIVISNEYDLQNLIELVLAPVVPIVREPFSVKCEGIKRTADFSLAHGRIVLELKFVSDRTELGAALKDARGVLDCYLDHPGVEYSVGIIGVTASANPDRNAIESWDVRRGDRRCFMRALDIPEILLTR